MVSAPSSLYLLLLLLALLLCLRLLLCWLPLPLLWVCGSRVGLCSGGFSWVSLASCSSAFPFSLLPVLCLLSPNPLGSAASASAHGLSGVQYSASSSASGLLTLFLSVCSLVLLTSACCSFRYLFCTSLSTFGFSFCHSFRPLCLFLSGFSRPSGRCCFFLLFFRLSCLSVSILYRSGAVFWASCPLGQPWFPVLWSPYGVSRFAALSLVLSGRRDSCILVC